MVSIQKILPDVWEILLKSLASYEIKSTFEDVVNPSLIDIHALQVEDVLVIPFGGLDRFKQTWFFWVDSVLRISIEMSHEGKVTEFGYGYKDLS